MEGFIPLKGYRSGYLINKVGTVISTLRGLPKVMSPTLDKDGYLKFTLLKEDGRTTAFQHRLIATHFIENPDNKPEVNHKDGNKVNNSISNLEWATKSENMLHSIRILNNPKPPSSKGKVGKDSKLSRPIVGYNKTTGETVRFYGSKDAQRVSEKYYTQGNISVCLKDKSKRHRGFHWYYEDEFEMIYGDLINGI